MAGLPNAYTDALLSLSVLPEEPFLLLTNDRTFLLLTSDPTILPLTSDRTFRLW